MGFGGIKLTGFDINYEVGVVFYETLRYWQGSGFWFWVSASGHWCQKAQPADQMRRARGMLPPWVTVFMAAAPPWRDEDMAKSGAEGEGGRENGRAKRGKPSVSGWGRVYYNTACWSCRPAGVCERLLPGAGCTWNETDSTASKQPNSVGRMRCYAEDAAVSMPSPSLPPSSPAPAHQLATFSSHVSKKSNATPCHHWYPELMNFAKTMCRFIPLPCELLKCSCSAPHARERLSKWLLKSRAH